MKLRKINNSAFTLIELLLVIAMMAIITSITLANYNGMNKNIELQNTAYNLALSIREAQIFGINKKLKNTINLVDGDDGFTDNNFYPYGVFIDIMANNKQIIVFRDRDNEPNSKFSKDCLNTTPIECERIIQFGLGNHISKIRLQDSIGSWQDFDGKLNILFKRPNPDAIILSESNISKHYSRVDLEVSSKNGKYKACVEIGTAGDITIKKDCN